MVTCQLTWLDVAANDAIRVLIHDEPSRAAAGHKRAVIPDPNADPVSRERENVSHQHQHHSLQKGSLQYEEEVNGESASSDEGGGDKHADGLMCSRNVDMNCGS